MYVKTETHVLCTECLFCSFQVWSVFPCMLPPVLSVLKWNVGCQNQSEKYSEVAVERAGHWLLWTRDRITLCTVQCKCVCVKNGLDFVMTFHSYWRFSEWLQKINCNCTRWPDTYTSMLDWWQTWFSPRSSLFKVLNSWHGKDIFFPLTFPDRLWGTRGPFSPRYNSQDIKLTTHCHLVPRLSVSRAVPPLLHVPSRYAQRKPGWSHSMSYTPHFNEDHHLLQKLFRTCTCTWPNTQLSQHHKHIIININSSNGV